MNVYPGETVAQGENTGLPQGLHIKQELTTVFGKNRLGQEIHREIGKAGTESY